MQCKETCAGLDCERGAWFKRSSETKAGKGVSLAIYPNSRLLGRCQGRRVLAISTWFGWQGGKNQPKFCILLHPYCCSCRPTGEVVIGFDSCRLFFSSFFRIGSHQVLSHSCTKISPSVIGSVKVHVNATCDQGLRRKGQVITWMAMILTFRAKYRGQRAMITKPPGRALPGGFKLY